MKLPAVLTKAFTLLRWSVADDAMVRWCGVRRSSRCATSPRLSVIGRARVRACVFARRGCGSAEVWTAAIRLGMES